MIIKYDIKQLNSIIKHIFDLTGISISILDTNYNVLANCSEKEDFCSLLQTIKDNKLSCSQCDQKILKQCKSTKKLEGHICWIGLYASSMPIVKDGIIVGYAIMGRVRSKKSPYLPNFKHDIDTNILNQLNKLYCKLPFITEVNLIALYALLPYILFDSCIQIEYNSFINELVNFINANLQDNLNVELLCAKFHVSKNYLYKAFANNFGCTVNGYISMQRLKLVKELLINNDDSIKIIDEKVGIYNYTYFCRWFKKTPEILQVNTKRLFENNRKAVLTVSRAGENSCSYLFCTCQHIIP